MYGIVSDTVFSYNKTSMHIPCYYYSCAPSAGTALCSSPAAAPTGILCIYLYSLISSPCQMQHRITHQIWFVYLMDHCSPRQEGNNSNRIALDEAILFTPHDDDNARLWPFSSSTGDEHINLIKQANSIHRKEEGIP